MGKIQTEDPPVWKKQRINPDPGEEKMAVEGVHFLWSHNVGKQAWEGVCRNCERKANQLCDVLCTEATGKWIAPLVGSLAFRGYVERIPSKNEIIGMPIAVIHDIGERLRTSEALHKDKEKIDWVLEKIRDNSRVLVLKASTVLKQIRSRENQNFPWTEYRKVQALLQKAEYLKIEERRHAIRLLGIAEHDRWGYKFALDFEKETKRSALVTLFTLGRNARNWQRQRKIC